MVTLPNPVYNVDTSPIGPPPPPRHPSTDKVPSPGPRLESETVNDRPLSVLSLQESRGQRSRYVTPPIVLDEGPIRVTSFTLFLPHRQPRPGPWELQVLCRSQKWY